MYLIFLKEAEAKIESLTADVEAAKSKSEDAEVAQLEATETSEQEQVNFDWPPTLPTHALYRSKGLIKFLKLTCSTNPALRRAITQIH